MQSVTFTMVDIFANKLYITAEWVWMNQFWDELYTEWVHKTTSEGVSSGVGCWWCLGSFRVSFGIGFGAILMHLSAESSLSMPVLHCKQQKWEGCALSVQCAVVPHWRMLRTGKAAWFCPAVLACSALVGLLSEEVPCCLWESTGSLMGSSPAACIP